MIDERRVREIEHDGALLRQLEEERLEGEVVREHRRRAQGHALDAALLDRDLGLDLDQVSNAGAEGQLDEELGEDAEGHAHEQIHRDAADGGHQEDHELLLADLPGLHQLAGRGETGTGVHQHRSERGEGDAVDEHREEGHEHQELSLIHI